MRLFDPKCNCLYTKFSDLTHLEAYDGNTEQADHVKIYTLPTYCRQGLQKDDESGLTFLFFLLAELMNTDKKSTLLMWNDLLVFQTRVCMVSVSQVVAVLTSLVCPLQLRTQDYSSPPWITVWNISIMTLSQLFLSVPV